MAKIATSRGQEANGAECKQDHVHHCGPTRDWVLVGRIAAMRMDVLGLNAASRNHSANVVPAVAAT